jgi:hypothetical protein
VKSRFTAKDFAVIIKNRPHELSSIGWDIALYVQEPGFEPQTLHLSIFKVEFQSH